MLCVVFPVGIAVGVVHRAERLAGCAGGVSVLALCQDVSVLSVSDGFVISEVLFLYCLLPPKFLPRVFEVLLCCETR